MLPGFLELALSLQPSAFSKLLNLAGENDGGNVWACNAGSLFANAGIIKLKAEC